MGRTLRVCRSSSCCLTMLVISPSNGAEKHASASLSAPPTSLLPPSCTADNNKMRRLLTGWPDACLAACFIGRRAPRLHGGAETGCGGGGRRLVPATPLPPPVEPKPRGLPDIRESLEGKCEDPVPSSAPCPSRPPSSRRLWLACSVLMVR